MHHYPRAICPFCFSDKTEWSEASGKGTIYTYSVMRRAPVPYAIAYVTLDEGPTMMTNIVDCDLDKLEVRPEGEGGLQADRGRPAGADVHAGLITVATTRATRLATARAARATCDHSRTVAQLGPVSVAVMLPAAKKAPPGLPSLSSFTQTLFTGCVIAQ